MIHQGITVQNRKFKISFSNIKVKINLNDMALLALIARIGSSSSKYTSKKQLKNALLQLNELLEVPLDQKLLTNQNIKKEKCQIMLYKFRQNRDKQTKQLVGMASINIGNELFEQDYRKIRLTNSFDKEAYVQCNVKVELGEADMISQTDSKMQSFVARSQNPSVCDKQQRKNEIKANSQLRRSDVKPLQIKIKTNQIQKNLVQTINNQQIDDHDYKSTPGSQKNQRNNIFQDQIQDSKSYGGVRRVNQNIFKQNFKESPVQSLKIQSQKKETQLRQSTKIEAKTENFMPYFVNPIENRSQPNFSQQNISLYQQQFPLNQQFQQNFVGQNIPPQNFNGYPYIPNYYPPNISQNYQQPNFKQNILQNLTQGIQPNIQQNLTWNWQQNNLQPQWQNSNLSQNLQQNKLQQDWQQKIAQGLQLKMEQNWQKENNQEIQQNRKQKNKLQNNQTNIHSFRVINKVNNQNNENNTIKKAESLNMATETLQNPRRSPMIKKNAKMIIETSNTRLKTKQSASTDLAQSQSDKNNNQKKFNGIRKIENADNFHLKPSSIMQSIKEVDNQHSPMFPGRVSLGNMRSQLQNSQINIHAENLQISTPFTATFAGDRYSHRQDKLPLSISSKVISLGYNPPSSIMNENSFSYVADQQSAINRSVSIIEKNNSRSYSKFNSKAKHKVIGSIKANPNDSSLSYLEKFSQQNNLQPKFLPTNLIRKIESPPPEEQNNNDVLGFLKLDQLQIKINGEKTNQVFGDLNKQNNRFSQLQRVTLQQLDKKTQINFRKNQKLLTKANKQLLSENKLLKKIKQQLEVEIQQKREITLQQFHQLKVQIQQLKNQSQISAKSRQEEQLKYKQLEEKHKKLQIENNDLKKKMKEERKKASEYRKIINENQQREKQREQQKIQESKNIKTVKSLTGIVSGSNIKKAQIKQMKSTQSIQKKVSMTSIEKKKEEGNQTSRSNSSNQSYKLSQNKRTYSEIAYNQTPQNQSLLDQNNKTITLQARQTKGPIRSYMENDRGANNASQYNASKGISNLKSRTIQRPKIPKPSIHEKNSAYQSLHNSSHQSQIASESSNGMSLLRTLSQNGAGLFGTGQVITRQPTYGYFTKK